MLCAKLTINHNKPHYKYTEAVVKEVELLCVSSRTRSSTRIHISHTMGTRALPDIYTLSPWTCGPQTSGVYIRQTTHARGMIITYARIYLYKLHYKTS